MEFTAGDDKDVDETKSIEWLRQRGVQVDIPSSRKDKHPVKPVDHSLDRPITIVKIPYDTKEPYEEITITVNDGIPGDQLITLLKSRFIGTGTESISNAALEKASENLLQSQPGEEPTSENSILNKSPEVQKSTLLNMFENQGHVESFSLTRAASSNQWKSIALYLDEGGQLKGLPSNPRAASMAAMCGYEGVSLAGDMYIARRYQEGVIRHSSFGLQELDSGAEWMRSAQRDNYAHGAANGQVSMDPSQSGGSGIDKGLHTSSDPLRAFEWSQDEDTVDVSFQLPAAHTAVTKKGLRVEISSRKLLVARRAEGGEDELVLLELELFAEVKASECTWSRSEGCIEFSLEKRKQDEDWAQLEQK